MEIEVTGGPLEAVDADTFALAIPDPADSLPPELEGLWTLVASGEAPTRRGTARLVHVDGRRLVAAGVGPRADSRSTQQESPPVSTRSRPVDSARRRCTHAGWAPSSPSARGARTSPG